MQQIRTVLLNKSNIDLKIISKLMINKEKFEIEGIYSNEKSILVDLEFIKPQLVLILKESENDNYELNELTKKMKKCMSSIVIIVVCIYGKDIIVNEVLSHLDICKNFNNFNVIAENLSKLLLCKCFSKEIYEDYIKLLEKIRIEEILDSFQLTETEKKIFYLKKVGLTRNEIAEKRIISNYTVKNHISSILRKMGVGSTRDALLMVDDIACNSYKKIN